ncbi:MAG TPA: hypothetical protein VGM98_17195 [Schlesneria sp.]|jgi:hypothetical protein
MQLALLISWGRSLIGNEMQSVFNPLVGGCYWIIAYIYPFFAVLRGSTVEAVVGKSWGMQMIYFIFLCIVLPGIGNWISPQFGRDLFNWVPEMPILIPTFLLGWVAPWLAGSIAVYVRRRLRSKSADVNG